MRFNCAFCGKPADKPASHVNRSRASGLRLYCGRACSGLGRRKWKSKDQRVTEKRDYDAHYRCNNRETLRAKKAAYHKENYDPKAAAVARRKRAPLHAEYCRRPEYKKWKKTYDSYRRAKAYGPASEAFLTLLELTKEIKGRMNNYEIAIQNGTFNKRQARRREEGAYKGTRNRDQPA